MHRSLSHNSPINWFHINRYTLPSFANHFSYSHFFPSFSHDFRMISPYPIWTIQTGGTLRRWPSHAASQPSPWRSVGTPGWRFLDDFWQWMISWVLVLGATFWVPFGVLKKEEATFWPFYTSFNGGGWHCHSLAVLGHINPSTSWNIVLSAIPKSLGGWWSKMADTTWSKKDYVIRYGNPLSSTQLIISKQHIDYDVQWSVLLLARFL